MLKALFVIFFVCTCSSLPANQWPEIIDFGKYATIDSGYYSSYEQEALDFGLYAFNYAPDLTPFFAILKTKYAIDAAVETGTYWGGTTLVFGLLFDKVYSI